MKKVFILSILFALMCSLPTFAADKFVLFMVDASGSMSQKLEGQMKMDIAKDAITSVLNEIPDSVPMGLRAYGHYFDRNKTDDENCLASELLVPIEKGTKLKIIQKVYNLSPRGHTPIAYSLSKAPEDFPHFDAERIIILVSDGKETCGGDPIAVINDLKRRGFKFVVHTVGFDVDEETRRQLKGISDASGGKYMDAGNAQELGESLKTVTKEIRQKITFGEDAKRVKPGRGFSDAGYVSSGETYAYNILPGETHYYKFDVEEGDKVTVTVTMKRHESGSVAADELEFTGTLYDPDKMVFPYTGEKTEKIGVRDLNPKSVRVESGDKGMPFNGQAFLAIGLNWVYPNDEHTTRGECTYTFVIRIEKPEKPVIRERMQEEEEGEPIDPGKGFSSATLIKPDILYKGREGALPEETHYYKFKVKKGDKITVVYTLKSPCSSTAYFSGVLYDPDRMKMVGVGTGGWKGISKGEKQTQRFSTDKGQYTSVPDGMPFDGEAYLTFNLEASGCESAAPYTFKIRIESAPEEKPIVREQRKEEGKEIKAGSSYRSATTIKSGIFYTSQILSGETHYYKIKARKDETFKMYGSMRWTEVDERRDTWQDEGMLYFEVQDEDRVKVNWDKYRIFGKDWKHVEIKFEPTYIWKVKADKNNTIWYLVFRLEDGGREAEGILPQLNYTFKVKLEKEE